VSMGTAWARTPLRIKVTLAFAGVMAVLLAMAGVALSVLSARNLDRAIDDGLAARAGDAAALLRQGAEPGRLSGSGEPLAQVLDTDGRVLDTTPAAGRDPLLTEREVQRTRVVAVRVKRKRIDGGPSEGVRLLARRAGTSVSPVIVVVGESLQQRDRALEGLHRLLAIGGPLALLIAALAGYAVVGAALRPVERMRSRAAAITAGETGGRLPVPPSHDEIARLGHTLNELLGRLEAALQRERSFVSDASHELRTPLAILRTELELALRGRSTRDELVDAVRSAAEEADRLNQLAEDLLVIARSDQGRLPVRRTDLPAGELLESVAHRFAARARAEQRPVRTGEGTDIQVSADPARVEQALANMVDNALRHGRGDVVLSACIRDGNVELHVRDEGPGFPPDFLGSAFERFSRADEARSRGGTGLGLAITDAVARAHGGSAHAANREEGGADVWLMLPDLLSHLHLMPKGEDGSAADG
jgi:two-component system, OmpR family, sensor kinase